MSRYIIGITGASGSVYAVKLLEELLSEGHEVHLTVTHNGLKVLEYELEQKIRHIFNELANKKGSFVIHDIDDLFAPIASGSFKTEGMAVIPCSMATLGEIACGTSKTLLGRAADVCIKEKRRLVLVPREMPLSTIHLRNMLSLSESGAVIMPAMPSFYSRPRSISSIIDSVVGRILFSLGVENKLYLEWGVQNEKNF